jgi:Ca2+-binding RTX toxin-like protein
MINPGRRATGAIVCGLILVLWGVTAGSASADATVSSVDGSTPGLKITSCSPSCAENYGLKIQPASSSSMRVGQVAFGDPAIRSSSANCTTDFFANAVTCSDRFGSLSIQLGAGADNVQYLNTPDPGSVPECVPQGDRPTIQVTADLGPGDDKFSTTDLVASNCPTNTLPADDGGIDVLDPSLFVSGGTGGDSISGGPLRDILLGGEGNDVLRGEAGNDGLVGGPGNDLLDGGGGDDQLFGSTGNDTIKGGVGNDEYRVDSTADGSDGSDSFDGGPGSDTANYSSRTCPLTVTIANGQADDGCAGEHDNIIATEQFLGGHGPDNITGSNAPETIDGGPGGDVINGGGGSDVLRGGAGEDSIFAIDGVPDTISCGPDNDVALIDLKDTLALTSIQTRFGTFQFPDCESVTRQAVDDSAPGRPVKRAVRLTPKGAVIKFRCPSRSKPACRGRLLLSDLYKPGHALARIRYSIRLGTTVAIDVPLTRASRRELRRSRHALVKTIERGHSKVGPRGAEFELPVAV